MNAVPVKIERSNDSWFKSVESLSNAHKNGFAFIGKFIREGINYLPVGTVVIECRPIGNTRSGFLYIVTDHGMQKITHIDNWKDQIQKLIDITRSVLISPDIFMELYS